MFDGYRIGAIILMGGEGVRFGNQTPKQFIFLGDKQIYLHTLEVFQNTCFFDEILLVCRPDRIRNIEALDVRVISGGATRQESSYLGLQGFSQKPDIVMIHDAVRPFVSERIIRENIQQAILHGAVDTCIPSADTLVYAPEQQKIVSIPKRENYLRGQTPQTFQYDLIWESHREALKNGVVNSSDDCRLALRKGHFIHVVTGSEENFKITTEFDLLVAESLLFAKK